MITSYKCFFAILESGGKKKKERKEKKKKVKEKETSSDIFILSQSSFLMEALN
jgi:hypothetical protein